MPKIVPLERFADELKRFSEDHAKDFKKAVVEALVDALPRLVAKSPVDTGLYAQSWSLDVDEKRAMIGNHSPYAPMIEFGTRPFTPPIGPLLSWAKRVLKKAEVDSECWAMAKGVQKKIAEHGLKPHHILTGEIDHIMEDIRNKLKERHA